MAVNKVTFDSATLIDLSLDTVASSSDIAQGKIGHLNDGSVVTGTASGGGGLPTITDWQFYPVNVSDLNMPTITMESYDDFTTATMNSLQVNNNRSQISNGNFYYYDSYYSHCLYYCDFGKEITDAVIVATKTESSNTFKFAFFNTDPTTFTANTNGIGYYPPNITGTTSEGTTQIAYLSSSYSARYMVVEVAYSTTASAPVVIWSDNNHNI